MPRRPRAWLGYVLRPARVPRHRRIDDGDRDLRILEARRNTHVHAATPALRPPWQGTAGPESVRPWSAQRSEEHTSELQSLMRISYAVFCLKKKTEPTQT